MKLTFDIAFRLAIPLGISAGLASRYFGLTGPSGFEMIYGIGMFLVLVVFLLLFQIKKKKKVVRFDLAGQPYESEVYDLESAPSELRNTVMTVAVICYFFVWWLGVEFALLLLR